MGVFRDEYGELVAWRVAAVLAIVIVVVAVAAFALFGRRTERGARDVEPVHTVATPGTGDPKADLGSWLAGIEGAERLSSIEGETLEGLRVAFLAWQSRTIGDSNVRVSVVGEPVVDGPTTTLRLRVTHEGGETWVEAAMSESTWAIEEHPEGFPASDAVIHVTDASALATVMPEEAAKEVLSQLAASGIDGIGEAWTTAESVSTEGAVTRLTVWVPTREGEPSVWDASFDEAVGMLQVAPQGEPLEEVA